MTDYMDMTGVAGRIAEFEKRHGGSQSAVYHNHRLWYPDGAMREKDPMGLLMEPPPHPYERAKLIHAYHEIIFKRAVQKFHDRKQQLVNIAAVNLNPPRGVICGTAPVLEDASRELKALKAVALEAKANMDKAAVAVSNAEPWQWKENRKQDAQNRNGNEQFKAIIGAIEL